MNSFFIPGLGGQIYAMAGMTTKLHLIANENGEFDGISANYSGAGFTGMKFKAIDLSGRLRRLGRRGQAVAKKLDKAEYDAWPNQAKQPSRAVLGFADLFQPSSTSTKA
jgi:cytochrome o ubiquinol oxidase subunit 2